MYALANLSLVPVRKDPSDKSEMVSQLLFGEMVEVIDNKESWIKIRMVYDDYIGWIDKKQVIGITDDRMQQIKVSTPYVSADLFQIVIWRQNQICPIVMGSSLPQFNNKKFIIGETEYSFEGTAIETTMAQPEKLFERAYLYLNSPYLWGGRSPMGIDCSGLTQMVFKLCGIKLKRDAWQQAEQGETINNLDESKPGDLAFFNSSEGRISHVGMLLPGNHIIHAHGKVRIDKIDKVGIYNPEISEYSHDLKLIKRIN
jgi:cell wall-associated NlpC family hydrolase